MLGAKEKAESLLDSAVSEGATVAAEGCPLAQTELAGGYFFAPRVVRLPDGPSPLRHTEAFAPIMSIVAADDVVEAGLEAITDSGMGLHAPRAGISPTRACGPGAVRRA